MPHVSPELLFSKSSESSAKRAKKTSAGTCMYNQKKVRKRAKIRK